MPADQRRQLNLLKVSLVLATPSDPKESEELTKLVSSMRGVYGKGKWCPGSGQARCVHEHRRHHQADGDVAQREGAPRRRGRAGTRSRRRCKKDYQRFAELSNKGAKELGFADTGAMWRAKYDMPPDAFTKELDRLWEQVRPLYLQLHAYVRMKLREKYGDVVPAKGPLPAHLLGNIWAQDWSNVYDLVAPANADAGYLADRHPQAPQDERDRHGQGRRALLHLARLRAAAADVLGALALRAARRIARSSATPAPGTSTTLNDVRIKMCIDQTAEDFSTIHHELGHNFYQRAYKKLPVIFRDSANDGFHEAIGDTIALSVTPEYLVKIGLLDKAPDASRDIGLLLSRALEKVAFLPFGLLIDQWRWKVFSGEITPAQLQQGVVGSAAEVSGRRAAVARAARSSSIRARSITCPTTRRTRATSSRDILQFQFHRALSKTAGCTTPLHRCSIYESKEAGQRLNAMLTMGLSKPWPDALAGADRLAARWTRRRSSTTSRRSRRGWRSRPRDSRSAGR